MKKFLYLIIVMIVVVFCSQSFAVSESNDSLENIELSKYYWVVPLHLNVHMEIWMWETDDEVISSYTVLLKDMKFYADIDVLKYLNKSIYPQTSLEKILNKMANLLNTAGTFITYIDNQKTFLVQRKDSCDNKKSITDKNFFLALKDLDWVNMERNLISSIESENCSVEARITYNAYDKMRSQVKYYYDILAKKYDYFYSNKYEILQSFK